MRPPAETAIRKIRGCPAASSRVPSGSMPATQRRTALAVSSGPSVRAASVRIWSVVARSMPFFAATATRAGVTAAVITSTWAAVTAPAA